MSTAIKALEPKEIWTNFAEINAIPRASKKEEKIISYMMEFGKGLGLETFKDKVGNVIIRKPATPGMEDRKTVVLQSHLDMVHQKNSETDFDFETEGIKMIVEDDWVKAKGTTLGADNGLGVATIMAVLQSDSISHPALEALFTIDEETGMSGAKGLEGGILTGEILLNLDTEEDDEIGVGCAGGVDVTARRFYIEEQTPEYSIGFKISVKGLKGGHSGMDIHKGLGNANKIMNRLLYHCFRPFGMRISEIEGGGLRNAIPRESTAWIVVEDDHADEFRAEFDKRAAEIKSEFRSLEPELIIEITRIVPKEKVMTVSTQEGLIKALYAAHNGVFRMSPDIPDLVETSNNLARVSVQHGQIKVSCLTRSSVESSKLDLAHQLKATFELAGCDVEFSHDYPGWTPNMDSAILKVMVDLYQKINGDQPHVAACHAGLECGILGTNYPGMDMVSFGPNILGAHSPDERAQISSVRKFWVFVKEILKNIPKS